MHPPSPQPRRNRSPVGVHALACPAEPTRSPLESGSPSPAVRLPLPPVGPGEIVATCDLTHVRSVLRADAASAGLLAEVEERLSPREKTVLWLFVQHCSAKGVAKQLGTELQTVKNQLATIRQKLQIGSLTELAKAAILALLHDPEIP